MEENTTEKEGEKTGVTTEETPPEGVKAPVDMIAKANAAAERLEKANLDLEKNLKKQEALSVEKTLGGKTEAGETIEETPAEYAKKVMQNDN